MVAVGRWLLSPKFKRCDERVIDGACEKTQTDDCCAVIPCKLCLRLEVYPDTYKSSAVWAEGAYTGQYTGTIDGHEFVAYWEKDAESGTCYFVVEWDGEEIGRYTKCGYEGMNCRSIGDTITVDTGYDETGELTFSMSEKIELPHYQQPVVRCNTLDVAFVLDDTGSMSDTLTELKDNIAEIVAQIEAVSESYQLALITFKDTVTTDLAFSENNGTAFTAALAGVSAAAGGNIPEASDVALETAVDLAGWRSGGVGRKKLCIIITDAPPGGLDDTDDEADLDNLVLQATRAGDNGIILAAVQSGTFTQTGTALRAAVTANGERARYIPSVTDMVSRIRGMIDTECPDHTPCTEPYCGEMQCVEKYICLTVTGPNGFSYTSDPIENNTDYDGCDIPEWDISVEDGYFSIDGTVALGRDDYTGECELTVPGADGYDQTAEITGTDPLTATWEVESDDPYEPYVFSIVGSDCGDCEQTITVSCCGGLDLPPTIPCTLEDRYGLCGSVTIDLANGGDPDEFPDAGSTPGGFWSGSTTMQIATVDAGGEICEPLTIAVRVYCDPGGPVFRLDYKCRDGSDPEEWVAAGATSVCQGAMYVHTYSETTVACIPDDPSTLNLAGGIDFMWWIP